MLPNVVYVGMGKAGSTLLHKLFLKHPDFYASINNKEINFFSRECNWKKGIDWYEQVFAGYGSERFVVDISPGYHNKRKCIDRIKQVLGDEVKIMFTFRRFTDFAFSRYLHRLRGKRIRGAFLELLEQRAMFYKPLDQLVGEYINAFGRENVLIMHYEKEFSRQAPCFEQRIYEFLGLPKDESYYEPGNDEDVNAGTYPRYVHANDEPYEEEYEGIRYRVPANRLVFCSGRPYKDVCWNGRVQRKAEEAFALQATWTTSLSEEQYSYVQERYTEPLARRLEESLDTSFEHWYLSQPRRLDYQPAPLPDAYILDPDLKAERMAKHKAMTPWS